MIYWTVTLVIVTNVIKKTVMG